MYMKMCTCTMYHLKCCSLFPAPPKVAEKPVRVDPDKLSFKEKLALHKKTLDEHRTSASSPVWPPLRPSSAREGYRRPATPELGVDRPSEQAKGGAAIASSTCNYMDV